MWIDYIFIGVGVNVLVFCDFKRDKMGWYHVPDDFEVRVVLSEHFGY